MVRLTNQPRTLGEHILVARYDRGRRQKDVARELGVDQFTLGNWEQGRTEPALRHRAAVHLWLGYCPVIPVPVSIGARLVAWRDAQGVTQKELAKQLGLDPGTLGRIEQGRGPSPSHRTLRLVSNLMRRGR